MLKKLTAPAIKAQPVPARTHTPAHAKEKATRAQAMKM